CHKSHHTMNAMGHTVKTYVGARMNEFQKRIGKLAPGYMPMGDKGMADMGEMEMPLPDNTLPMMTGFAQFGAVEMGGMFSILKVREGLGAKDYKAPGWFKHPPGSVAYEVKGASGAEAPRQGAAEGSTPAVKLKVIKPGAAPGHSMEH